MSDLAGAVGSGAVLQRSGKGDLASAAGALVPTRTLPNSAGNVVVWAGTRQFVLLYPGIKGKRIVPAGSLRSPSDGR
jgi:hypothetical protein